MQNIQTHPLEILVKGWRGISHSYALVNQFQLLHWKKSGLARIHHLDMPFVKAHWANGDNSAGFNKADLNLIENISEKIEPKAIYRIFAPFALDTRLELPTVTFGVTEFGLNSKNYDQTQVDTYASAGGKIHTPSQWSKKRLVASGIPDEIIHVIPHSADTQYFFPIDAATSTKNRQTLGYTNEDVILLNVGTHHWNKGLDVVIKAFAKARQTNKRLKLLLKDQRFTYLMNSNSFVQQTLQNIGITDAETIDSIRLLSGHLNLAQLNSLYNMADAYLTPYRAEGFNLPALEAQTCGTPVIATAGGATDDFLNRSKNIFIEGQFFENAVLNENLKINAYIEPNIDHLIQTLEKTSLNNFRKGVSDQLSWLDACTKLNHLFMM